MFVKRRLHKGACANVKQKAVRLSSANEPKSVSETFTKSRNMLKGIERVYSNGVGRVKMFTKKEGNNIERTSADRRAADAYPKRAVASISVADHLRDETTRDGRNPASL